jgi:hypothetical protein
LYDDVDWMNVVQDRKELQPRLKEGDQLLDKLAAVLCNVGKDNVALMLN